MDAGKREKMNQVLSLCVAKGVLEQEAGFFHGCWHEGEKKKRERKNRFVLLCGKRGVRMKRGVL